MADESGPAVVTAIHIAPGRRLPVKSVDEIEAEEGKGLVGDRYHGTRHRHVTVQSATGLAAAATELGRLVPPEGTRRNITISHGEVPSTPGTLMRIGPVLLEVVRVAAPCRLLEDDLGPGAPAALRRRAGSAFRVLEGGRISVGDRVELLEPAASPRTGSPSAGRGRARDARPARRSAPVVA